MRLSIRAKLVALICLASLLPLMVGVISVAYLGFRDYQHDQGRMYRASAVNTASGLNLLLGEQIDKLGEWTALSSWPAQVSRFPEVGPAEAARLDGEWPRLATSASPLRDILHNDLADRLHAFQQRNPIFVELFVTGPQGQVIASTNKTSDYRQADEEWWQKAWRMKPNQAYVEGINYDDSAKIHALEISLPVRSDGRNVGVLKAVLNVSALFGAVPVVLDEPQLSREVVLNDGRVLAKLGIGGYKPLSEHVNPSVMQVIRGQWEASLHIKGSASMRTGLGAGWLIAPMDTSDDNGDALVGYAALRVRNKGIEGMALAGLTPMSVLVSNDADIVLAPVRRQLLIQAVTGLLLLFLFGALGLSLAQRKFIQPLVLLRRAARGLAATATFEAESAAQETQQRAHDLIGELDSITTRDELESLSRDFATMGRHVMSYHEQLEKELSLKTGEIQRDLQMAREFQEAMLPHDYPQVSSGDARDALSLSFHHIYQPAAAVCGDFFDVFKISESCAGVFIADVMGHGARSALVTAILRTLLQDVAGTSEDPARLMEEVNRHFCKVLRGTGQFVFASAFCLVLDTRLHEARFATAGHPSPAFIDRTHRRVDLLLPDDFYDPDHFNLALGVDGDSTYTLHSQAIYPGDAFLLYTDGVLEAPNPQRDEFGSGRLCGSLRRRLDQPISQLCQGLRNDVNQWMRGCPSPDDICLIGVEIDSAAGLSEVATESAAQEQILV